MMPGSSEMMWAMINTVQILYFYPMLSMYYPVHYSELLGYMGAANMEFDIPIESEYQDRLHYSLINSEELEILRENNENFRAKGFENKSILNNISDVVKTVC